MSVDAIVKSPVQSDIKLPNPETEYQKGLQISIQEWARQIYNALMNSTDLDTIYTRLDGVNSPFTGPIYFSGNGSGLPYGGIHVHDASAAQTVPTGATYTKLTHYADNDLALNVTPDAANDKITITKAGVYLLNCSLNFSDDTNNVEWRIAPFLNAVEQDHIHVVRKIGTAGDVGSASMTGFIDVTTVPWDLDIRGRHDKGGNIDIIVEYSNFNVTMVGGT